MANLTRTPSLPQRTTGALWEPLRMMRELLGFDPFGEMVPMTPPEDMSFQPRFEVKETPDAFVFRADVPGVREEDLDISLASNRLTIAGKRDAEERKEGERWFAFERSYGTFTRSFTLPEGVDAEHVDAALLDGVLTLTLRKQPEAQPKKIQLKQQPPGKARA